MEYSLSFAERAPEDPHEREDLPRPSRIQRALRSLLAPVLLGGAVAATTLPPPAEGESPPPQEEKKAEDPILFRLRQEIPALITDLNHSHFRVREQAQRRLREIATEWVKMKQQLFPLLPLLRPTKEHSTEQSRRLQSVLAAHEHEELQLLWRPTMVSIPPQWQGRDRPMLTDVLRELSSQTGYHLAQSRLTTQEELQQKKIAFPQGGQRTFWEVGKVVHDTLGNLQWDVRSDGRLQYSIPYPRSQWTCPKGAAMAMLHALHSKEDVALSVTLEPKLIFRSVAVEQWAVVGENGKTVTIREPAQQSRMLAGIKLPSIPNARKAQLSATVRIIAHEPVTVQIAHLKKGQDIMKTPSFTLRFQDSREEPEHRLGQWPMIWRVRVTSPNHRAIVEEQVSLIRCRAFNAKGQLIVARSAEWGGGWAEAFEWAFWEEPSRIEFIVPGRTTTRTETFTFADVPLP